jgi:hypothetical protein
MPTKSHWRPADVIAALKASRVYCHSVFGLFTELGAQETVAFFSQDSVSVDCITLTPDAERRCS